ncbi:hypothetical protein PAHAL_1G415000 [Panicum hallii]|jgi:hypothetical protein|uniref:Uncharacterized protein n=1 Tax=Panicum hallii TaxID=206008 RepID=A0A2S3GU11_9POAL|nr:hypothetical protein PAHAL_1G415000 [Panicum hallii]
MGAIRPHQTASWTTGRQRNFEGAIHRAGERAWPRGRGPWRGHETRRRGLIRRVEKRGQLGNGESGRASPRPPPGAPCAPRRRPLAPPRPRREARQDDPAGGGRERGDPAGCQCSCGGKWGKQLWPPDCSLPRSGTFAIGGGGSPASASVRFWRPCAGAGLSGSAALSPTLF